MVIDGLINTPSIPRWSLGWTKCLRLGLKILLFQPISKYFEEVDIDSLNLQEQKWSFFEQPEDHFGTWEYKIESLEVI